MLQIRPISDLRNKFTEISKAAHENQEPIILTRNGYGDMVVMSYECFARCQGGQSPDDSREGVAMLASLSPTVASAFAETGSEPSAADTKKSAVASVPVSTEPTLLKSGSQEMVVGFTD